MNTKACRLKLRPLKTSLLTLALLTCALGNGWAQIVLNGSFETPVVTGNDGNFETYAEGSTTITGWTVGENGVNLFSYPLYGKDVAGRDGDQAVQLNGGVQNGNGSISQDIATTIGQEYEISFLFSANPFANAGDTFNGTVFFGADSYDFSFTVASTDISSFTFVLGSFNSFATSTTTSLAFVQTSGPSGSDQALVIDNVVVTAVPEPSTYLMLGLGLGSLFFLRRRSPLSNGSSRCRQSSI